MSDERDDRPGRNGPRGGAGRGDKPGGKPKFGKPAAKKGDRPTTYRTERTPRPVGASGDKRAFEPRRDEASSSSDKPKRSYKPRAEGGDRPHRKPVEGGAKREYRPRRDDAVVSSDAPKRAYRPRSDNDDAKPRGEGRTFRKSGPGERPFSSKGGDKPYRKPAATGEKREYRPRQEGDRPPRRDGDRPFRERDESGSAPRPGRRERTETTGGETRTFRPREDRPDRGPRPDRPFRSREEGDRSFRKRDDADRPRSAARPSSARRHERDEAAPEEGERIAKRLARAGISSRRDAEEMIAAGRVKVNGKVLSSPAVNVGPDDAIQVDNEPIPAIERTRLFLFHKPGGVVTTNRDPEGRKTVFDVLPAGLPRLITVGRLDINTEGLLLLTNDGGLARVLELPATGWLRRYRVRVHGRVDEKALAGLKDGIAVDGVFYGAIEASLDREQGTNAWLTIGLREGKNREVKNVLGALGLDVSRLIRISFGPFQLGELAEGAVQELKGRAVRDQLGDRLIAEAGANFEAPVVTEFSNRPVVRSRSDDAEAKPARRERPEPGEGGLIKNRKRAREDHREDMLGRLGTKPEGGRFAPKGAKGKRPEKPFEPPKSRSANVWMAPGARPQPKANDRSTSDKRNDGSQGRKRPAAADPSFRPRGPRKPRKDD